MASLLVSSIVPRGSGKGRWTEGKKRRARKDHQVRILKESVFQTLLGLIPNILDARTANDLIMYTAFMEKYNPHSKLKCSPSVGVKYLHCDVQKQPPFLTEETAHTSRLLISQTTNSTDKKRNSCQSLIQEITGKLKLQTCENIPW